MKLHYLCFLIMAAVGVFRSAVELRADEAHHVSLVPELKLVRGHELSSFAVGIGQTQYSGEYFTWRIICAFSLCFDPHWGPPQRHVIDRPHDDEGNFRMAFDGLFLFENPGFSELLLLDLSLAGNFRVDHVEDPSEDAEYGDTTTRLTMFHRARIGAGAVTGKEGLQLYGLGYVEGSMQLQLKPKEDKSKPALIWAPGIEAGVYYANSDFTAMIGPTISYRFGRTGDGNNQTLRVGGRVRVALENWLMAAAELNQTLRPASEIGENSSFEARFATSLRLWQNLVAGVEVSAHKVDTRRHERLEKPKNLDQASFAGERSQAIKGQGFVGLALDPFFAPEIK
ncbi:MAG: hypothetical protein AB1540_07370 [Bdellovibrionota bacterium]